MSTEPENNDPKIFRQVQEEVGVWNIRGRLSAGSDVLLVCGSIRTGDYHPDEHKQEAQGTSQGRESAHLPVNTVKRKSQWIYIPLGATQFTFSKETVNAIKRLEYEFLLLFF